MKRSNSILPPLSDDESDNDTKDAQDSDSEVGFQHCQGLAGG